MFVPEGDSRWNIHLVHYFYRDEGFGMDRTLFMLWANVNRVTFWCLWCRGKQLSREWKARDLVAVFRVLKGTFIIKFKISFVFVDCYKITTKKYEEEEKV